jgi:hypothetical protein
MESGLIGSSTPRPIRTWKRPDFTRCGTVGRVWLNYLSQKRERATEAILVRPSSDVSSAWSPSRVAVVERLTMPAPAPVTETHLTSSVPRRSAKVQLTIAW